MTKSYAKNMLILVLVGVVSFVFVLSFGYASIAFNIVNNGYVEGIASAEVSSIVTNTDYSMVTVNNSDLGTVGDNHISGSQSWTIVVTNQDTDTSATYNWYKANMFISSTQVNFSLIWYVNDPDSTGWSTCQYIGYFAGNYKKTGMSDDGWYTGTYRRSDGAYTSVTNLDDLPYDYTISFSTLPYYIDNTSYAVYNLHFLLDNYDTSDAPHFVYGGIFRYLPASNTYPLSDDINIYSLSIYYVQLTDIFYENNNQAGRSVILDLIYDFDSVTEGERFSINETTTIYPNENNEYYLALCAPHTYNNMPSLECTAIHIKYSQGTDYYTFEESDDNTDLNYFAWPEFQSNYYYFASLSSNLVIDSGAYNRGYYDGLQDGAEGAVDNNLVNLVWKVFEMPFKLLFGQIDNNVGSPTYGEYVGGLFSFTILGLDLRAFAISLMSVCILISIFRTILGVKQGGILK